jgi:Ca2+-binding RTX toxin-like protein
MRALGASLGLAFLLLATSEPAVRAGTVGTGPGDAVGFTAGASEPNRVTLTTSGDRIIVGDTGVASMTMQGSCTAIDPQTASCPATSQTRVTVTGGDLDDVITNSSSVGAELLGGDGHDTLTGSGAADRLDGEAGPDDLDGGPGDDVLSPGPGPPAADADTVTGGDGIDAVSYAARSNAVGVSQDGVANDGAPGEGDNVALDVEQLAGGAAGDRLAAGPAANRVAGGPGADVIDGGAGDDTVEGEAGTDTLSGGPGADEILGGPDDDRLTYPATLAVTASLDVGVASSSLLGDSDRVVDVEDVAGGDGRDTVTGAAEANTLTGALGEDYIDGRQGVDGLEGGADADLVVSRDDVEDEPVSCGPGTDLAIADSRDQVARTGPGRCERVDDGTRTRPRPGVVYLDRMRCRAGTALGLELPAMRRWVPLRYSILLPAGYRGRRPPRLDATDCTVRVRASRGAGRTASADVSGTVAWVAQTSSRGPATSLAIARPRCGGAGSGALAQVRERRLRVRTDRRRGRWRVAGRHSIAAAVGTDWSTVEGCSRTVTIVRRGRVRVLDRARGRTVVVGAGERYVARRRTR